MEDNVMTPALPEEGMCPCDREVFERVWRRVMPNEENSPIRLMPPEGQSRPTPEQSLQEEQNGLAVPPCRHRDTEREDVCLGRSSEMYAALLREMIDGETEDWRTYQAMARRAGGSAAKILGAMAADERRHAKRLGAAHFIITGQRYQSPNRSGSRPTPELMNGLREQFIQEQRGAAAYQGAAQESSDACLRQLYQELAEEEMLHAGMLRSLLEQM